MHIEHIVAPFILNLSTRWRWSDSHPGHLTPHQEHDIEWVPQPIFKREKLVSTGNRTRNIVYQLRYPGFCSMVTERDDAVWETQRYTRI